LRAFLSLPNDGGSSAQVHGKLQVALVNGECDKVSHAVRLVSVVEQESVHGIGLEDDFELEPRQNSSESQSTIFQIRGAIKRRNLLLGHGMDEEKENEKNKTIYFHFRGESHFVHNHTLRAPSLLFPPF